MRETTQRKPQTIGPRIKSLLAASGIALLLATQMTPSWAGNSAAQSTIVATVKGMSCPFCTYGLRKELLTVPGVKDVQVSLRRSEATITVGPGTHVTDEQIRQAIREAGFSPSAIKHP